MKNSISGGTVMKKMNKYMKTTIITVIILALFTIAQRDKIIGYFEPKCMKEQIIADGI